MSAKLVQNWVVRAVALVWLVAGALAFAWIVQEYAKFHAEPEPARGDDLGLAAIVIFVGIPACIQVILATWLLLARSWQTQRVVVIVLCLLPTMLLIFSWPSVALLFVCMTVAVVLAGNRLSRA